MTAPYISSAPSNCQHALAAAEDFHILSDYLLWVHKTKKNLNVSQLISGSVPKDAEKNSQQGTKVHATKTKIKEPAEVTCVSLSLTCSTLAQESSLLPNSSSSNADMVDFKEQSAVIQ